MIRKWQQLASQIIFDTPYFNIRRDHCRLPDGREVDDYYVLQSADIVLIATRTQTKEFVMVEQYKHGISDICLEIPGGMCEPDSYNILEDAKRELREETGYVSDKWHKLATLAYNPTRSNNHIHLYLALDATVAGVQSLDPNEDIAVRLIPQGDVMTAIRENKINVPDSITGLMLALDRLAKMEEEICMMNDDQRMKEITEVQAKYVDELMQFPNVVGVGVGMRQRDGEYTDEMCLVVMVDEKLPIAQLEPESILPTEIEGVGIDVQETGSFNT